MEEEGPCTGPVEEADSMRLVAAVVDFEHQVEAGASEAHQAVCRMAGTVGNVHTARSAPRGWNEVLGGRAEPIATSRGEHSREHTSVPARFSEIGRVAMTCAGLGAEK
jgi:hypothetical protein